MKTQKECHYCDGKGYINIRDCVGDIQRSENCSFCSGTGFSEAEEPEREDNIQTKYKTKNNL